ncbi:MAG TPA: hypothetical protein VJK26_00125, partial [Patescibacteria group bacterium]|nr:hypothetical protein [Patescibacteria group bacterium]
MNLSSRYWGQKIGALLVLFLISYLGFSANLVKTPSAKAASGPANFQATAMGPTIVDLKWDAVAGALWYDTQYRLSTNPTFASYTCTYITTTNCRNTRAADTQLTAETAYVFQVRAWTTSYTDWSTATVTTLPQPQWIGRALGMGEAVQIAYSGNFAYVTSSVGFHIADVSTPSKILIKSTLEVSQAYAVAVSGNYAYVGTTDNNFKVIQVSDPTKPSVVGSLTLGETINGITISGTKAYVSAGTVGLVIVNVSSPSAPNILGTLNTPGFARASAISGTTAVIADEAAMITADVSNPAAPQQRGTLATSTASDVVISGSYAFVADAGAGGGLVVANIANPSLPQKLTTLVARGNLVGLTLAGSYLYGVDSSGLTTNNGLEVFDISSPSAPRSVGFLALTGFLRARLVLSGSTALVASGQNGLATVNVATPASPQLIANLLKVDRVGAVATSGSYLYAANFFGLLTNLWIFNISQANSPVHVATMNLGSVNDLTIEGNYLYAADGNTLKIINIQNPSQPVQVSSLNLPDYASGLAVTGGKAYIADSLAGLVIVNVSNPSAPTISGQTDTPGYAFGVAVSGSIAILADGTGGIRSIDVTDSSAPRLLGSLSTASAARDVAISGSYAYVAAGRNLTVDKAALYAVNFSNPSALQQTDLRLFRLSAYALGVSISGTNLFVATGDSLTDRGLQIFSLIYPASPQETVFLLSGGAV